ARAGKDASRTAKMAKALDRSRDIISEAVSPGRASRSIATRTTMTATRPSCLFDRCHRPAGSACRIIFMAIVLTATLASRAVANVAPREDWVTTGPPAQPYFAFSDSRVALPELSPSTRSVSVDSAHVSGLDFVLQTPGSFN